MAKRGGGPPKKKRPGAPASNRGVAGGDVLKSRKQIGGQKGSSVQAPKKKTLGFLDRVARERRDVIKLPTNDGFAEAVKVEEPREKERQFNTKRDLSFRMFKDDIKEMISKSDIVLEILDARDPLACRNESLERKVLSAGKKLIFVINKSDLVPDDVLHAWNTYLRQIHPTVCFKAASMSGGRVAHLKCKTSQLSEADRQNPNRVAGVDELLAQIRKDATTVTVGLLGIPNVGKSSIINSLKRERVAKAGATPGVTTESARIKLGDGVSIYDAPGVVGCRSTDLDDPKSLVLANAISGDNEEQNVAMAELCLSRVPMEVLLDHYDENRKVITCESDLWTSVDEFLAFVARKEGRMNAGKPDKKAAAVSVVRDLRNGRIRFFETPPILRNAQQTRALRLDASNEVQDEVRIVSLGAATAEQIAQQTQASSQMAQVQALMAGFDDEDDDEI